MSFDECLFFIEMPNQTKNNKILFFYESVEYSDSNMFKNIVSKCGTFMQFVTLYFVMYFIETKPNLKV